MTTKLGTMVLIATLNAAAHAAQAPLIRGNDLRRLMLTREAGLTIVDVRPPDAYAAGHIQGARNVEARNIAGAGLSPTAHVVVYCSEATCALSAKAAGKLIEAGYTKVNLLEGGFGEWLKRGYPATVSAPAAPPERDHLALKAIRKGIKDQTAFALDVRSPGEFKAGHLPRAYNAPLEELESHYVDIPKNKKIVNGLGPLSSEQD